MFLYETHFSCMETALGVIIQVKITFVGELYLYFHCITHRNLFLLFFRLNQTADVQNVDVY